VAALVATVLFVGVLLVTVFPTRTYLSQRASVRQAERRLAALDRENRRLERTAHRLSTPHEVERMARERYGLVRPGEQAYAVLPPPVPPIGLPPLWPFAGVDRALAPH